MLPRSCDAIEKVPGGAEHVVQLCMDNAPVCKAAAQLVLEE